MNSKAETNRPSTITFRPSRGNNIYKTCLTQVNNPNSPTVNNLLLFPPHFCSKWLCSAEGIVKMYRKCSLISTIFALLTILVFAGCARQESYPVIVSTPTTPPPVGVPAIVPAHRIVGNSVQRRPILCTTLGRGQDVTLILATIHGNEPAGTPLVRMMEKYLQRNPKLLTGRKVVLLPVANPDGMANNSRYNANGVDLNRNFATANRSNTGRSGRVALSEPEARTIERLIRQYHPDRIVSIHQPLACVDYDGPALPLAYRMSKYCDLPVKKLGAKPGSLGSYAGLTLGIPIITLELPSNASSIDQERLWQQYGPALLAALTYPEKLPSK